MPAYQPPFQITSRILSQVAAISELIGRWSVSHTSALSPQLRRENRIRTIHASLAIESNTLSLDQVTAVFEGKQVLGLPREIQEVRNAILAYEQMEHWSAHSPADLRAAHKLLMSYGNGLSSLSRPPPGRSHKPGQGMPGLSSRW